MSIDRRAFLEACSALGLGGTLFPGALYAETQRSDRVSSTASGTRPTDDPAITVDHVAAAETIAGLSFTLEERELLVDNLNELLTQYGDVRALEMPNARVPAVSFDPRIGGASIPPVPDVDGVQQNGAAWTPPASSERPASDEDLAFAGVARLGGLLRAGAVTSVELTELFLARLKRLDPQLKAVVSYTEDRAMDAARRADDELQSGRDRGPLHGIPYGAKDLLAVAGTKTTWGATPYKEQSLDATATVVDRLDAAGAVLVAKLSLGALAWGDVWFGGTTKNPWNVEQGSSGSSAGPGSAVAAGAVPFAIGSETLGSIVSPSTRNGVTGHRPTFGAVPRHGAMTLSWTMDKLGPMTRSALDCALVYDALRGADPRDPTSVDVPFPFDSASDVTDLRVGFAESAFAEDYDNAAADRATLDVLRDLGVTLHPIELPTDHPVGAILNVLDVEAAAAFDALTRSDAIDTLVRQGENTWPNVFRSARFIPAVEFVQMMRARTGLMQAMHDAVSDVDAFVTPSYAGGALGITNLTGHPCVCVPNAFHPAEDQPAPRKQPGSITFHGALYRDAAALRLAHAYQDATDFHRRRPPVR